jgi:hypothetical protein
MLRSILIVSWDQRLLDTRVLVLNSRGFAVVGTTSVDEALKIANSAQPHLVIVCQTLSEPEQSLFLNALPRVCPSAFILRLHGGEVAPYRLFADCERYFAPMDSAIEGRTGESQRLPSRLEDEQHPDPTILQWQVLSAMVSNSIMKMESQNG